MLLSAHQPPPQKDSPTMCGIAFWSKAPKNSKIPDARRLAKALLGEIESRGRMAAGVAWHGPTRVMWWQKGPMTGTRLGQQLKLSPSAPQGILHTRFATKGLAAVNGNNHPIVRPGIVLVHNGMVHNDDDLFATTLDGERYAQVDSEAIAAALTQFDIDKALAMCEGSVAALWMEVTAEEEGNDPIIHAARCSSSPLWLAQTKAGDTIGASTKLDLTIAARSANIDLVWFHEMKEWTYARINAGSIEEIRDMPEPDWSKHWIPPSWRGGYTHAGAWSTSTKAATTATGRDHLVKCELTAAQIIRDQERFERQERLLRDDSLTFDEWQENLDAVDDETFDSEDLAALLQWKTDNEWRTGANHE